MGERIVSGVKLTLAIRCSGAIPQGAPLAATRHSGGRNQWANKSFVEFEQMLYTITVPTERC